jgi:hypothetical protein
MRVRSIVAVLIAVAGLAACGEDRQVVTYEKGKYQGRVDGKPWDAAPNAWSGTSWKPGDRTSWEATLRQRAQGQNEYARAAGN